MCRIKVSVLGGKPAKPPVPVVFGTAQGKEIAAVSALAETPSIRRIATVRCFGITCAHVRR